MNIVAGKGVTLHDLIQTAPRFHRAINLRYDLGDAAQVAAFIPTPNTAIAIATLLNATADEALQRAHILVGAYGAGKSLLAVILAALFKPDNQVRPALNVLSDRMTDVDPEAAAIVQKHLSTGRCWLPVVLVGDEGELPVALGRALVRALQARPELADIVPNTAYKAALDTVALWAEHYPDVHRRLTESVRDRLELDLETFKRALDNANPHVYGIFTNELYPQLSAGAEFYPHNGRSITDVLVATSVAVRERGYEGVVILYDEFGRFLESRTGQPFGREAVLLQDLAETCNRSGQNQLHLVLIAHKELPRYASGLPDEFQQEWARIAHRFRTLSVAGDPQVSYRLLASALQHSDEAGWQAFLEQHRGEVDELLARTLDTRLFPELEDITLRRVLEATYPLHPLTTYCLPRLSERVAQNERTLFTFLAGNDRAALGSLLADWISNNVTFPLVRPWHLWDYFVESIKVDTGPGGVHSVWATVESTLKKVGMSDDLTFRLVKTLGILHATGVDERLRPTTELLAFALGETLDTIGAGLERLKARKVVLNRRSVGYWEFVDSSDVDFEREVAARVSSRPAAWIKLRLLMERALPPKALPARRYTDEWGTIRFFRGLYRFGPELSPEDNWDAFLVEQGYTDGFVIYVLAMNGAELARAREQATQITHQQLVFVVPQEPLVIVGLLDELYALQDMEGDLAFNERDPRIPAEIEFFKADCITRLQRALAPIADPRRQGADWFWQGSQVNEVLDSPGRVSAFLSQVCGQVFSGTPPLFNEAYNKRTPSQQQLRAAEAVMDAFLQDNPPLDLGLVGYGPDRLIALTVLKATGILKPDVPPIQRISRPDPERFPQMAGVWDHIENFFEKAAEQELEFAEVLHMLQRPAFGLRWGILPLLTAAVLRRDLAWTTIRLDNQVMMPIRGATFTEMCTHPHRYTVRIRRPEARQQAVLAALEDQFGHHLPMNERSGQPLRDLGLALIRWLQSLPKYARDTRRLSPDGVAFVHLIRLAVTDPARALLLDLPDLAVAGTELTVGFEALHDVAGKWLHTRAQELESAHDRLMERLHEQVTKVFTGNTVLAADGAQAAISTWLAELEAKAGQDAAQRLFDDPIFDGLVSLAKYPPQENFVEHLARRLIGLPTCEWTDHTEGEFGQRLIDTKARLEHELLQVQCDELIEVTLNMPGVGPAIYRFRSTPLSRVGKMLADNLKRSMDFSGRSLSADERRQVVLEVLSHVMGR